MKTPLNQRRRADEFLRFAYDLNFEEDPLENFEPEEEEEREAERLLVLSNIIEEVGERVLPTLLSCKRRVGAVDAMEGGKRGEFGGKIKSSSSIRGVENISGDEIDFFGVPKIGEGEEETLLVGVPKV